MRVGPWSVSSETKTAASFVVVYVVSVVVIVIVVGVLDVIIVVSSGNREVFRGERSEI